MLTLLADIVLFQLAWFAAVWGGANGFDFVGTCPALALFALHILRHQRRSYDVTIITGTILFIGVITELLIMKIGLLTYSGATASSHFPPLWILGLWLSFSTLPEGALSWLTGRVGLQMIAGAIGGGASYYAGARLGAAQLQGDPLGAVAGIALLWAVALPLCFHCVQQIKRGMASIKAA